MILNARLVAGRLTDAAMRMSMYGMAAIEDIEGAIASGDPSTAIESAHIALTELRYCELLVDGRVSVQDHALLDLVGDTDSRLLPVATEATRSDALEALKVVLRRRQTLLDRLPFTFPLVRTPEGLFPTIRTMREMDRLRSSVGLDPYPWDFG